MHWDLGIYEKSWSVRLLLIPLKGKLLIYFSL